MKKILCLILSSILLGTMLIGCGEKDNNSSENKQETKTNQTSEKTVVHVGAMTGPTGMGMVKLMEDADKKTTANDYKFTLLSGVDEVVPKVAQGEVDIMAVPANLASVLYKKTDSKVKVIGINTLGVLYIVEKGENIKDIKDLKDKTIYASGKGATPEYALNYILKSNGLEPGSDVTIEYKSEQSEVVAALAKNEKGIAMLPQPFVTTASQKDSNIKIALDLSKEWDSIEKDKQEKSTMVTGVVVVRKEFLDSNTEAVNKFLEEYKKSTEYVNANIEESATLMENYKIVPSAVAKKAIPYCNITLIQGDKMKENLSGYLKVLMEQNPKSIGGALPDEQFYYIPQ